ncbi:glucan 1,4-alpha-glucosidase [Kroppenstedtia guangzhouensis]|uniref:Glucan 1,4-alpha-glucosidase n=1 Tax=Kroppenstedtia guangzhouensis TaxID=1274356 RepID=A0ABQ1GM22_9BACL|nr:hypothetical protein [Kroppenstedtia guangzhouensis]GGA46249.1 glucan 1,4-alpha-glucosidase [Kroppenstedtia guangzhouensis]
MKPSQTKYRLGWGTAQNHHSKVWFTLTEEALGEVFYPDLASPRFRRLQWTVADGSIPLQSAAQQVEPVEEHSLAFRQLLMDTDRRLRVNQTVITDPLRQSLALRVQPNLPSASPGDLHLSLQLTGNNHRLRIDSIGGRQALILQEKEGAVTVVASTVPLGSPVQVTEAGILSIPIHPGKEDGFTLVLSFGETEAKAVEEAEGTLRCPWPELLESYNRDWQLYCRKLNSLEGWAPPLYYQSLMLFRALEDKKEPGSFRAGFPEDAADSSVQTLIPLLTAFWAAGELQTPKRALKYLLSRRQQADGGFLPPSTAGNPSSPEETACIIQLAWQLEAVRLFEKGIRSAADSLVKSGGTTPPETGIAALICAADLAESRGDKSSARRYRETADRWLKQQILQAPESFKVEELIRHVRMGVRPARDPLVRTALEKNPSFGQPGTENGQRLISIGERAHYELLLDRDVTSYLSAIETLAEKWGLLPETEQGGTLPDLAAHAEYVRLLVSQSWGTPCDLAPVVAERYANHPPATS